MNSLSEILKLGQDMTLGSIKEILEDLDNLWINHRHVEYNKFFEEFEEKFPGFQIRRSTPMGEKHGIFLRDETTSKSD